MHPLAYTPIMPLTCNIDAKGKRVRLFMGIFQLLAAGLLAIFWAWPAGTWQKWLVVGLLAGFGGLAVFEARAGWCIVRAMGIKTRI